MRCDINNELNKGDKMVKLLKKGIRINGEYYSVHYSPSASNINGNATIYCRTYKQLPKEIYSEFIVDNQTDIMTDYFEKDKIKIPNTSKYFNIVNELAGSK